MKKLLLILPAFVCYFSLISSAQNTLVPNGGFEVWDDFGTLTLPDNWPSSDLLWHYNGDTTTKTVKSSTNSHSGKFAAWIGPDTANGKIWPGFIATRFAYSARPHHLSFFFIDSLDTIDKGVAVISFFKYNPSTQNNDSVGGATWNFPTGITKAYAQVLIPLFYTSSDTTKKPDTCTIKFLIASGSTAKRPGHILIDDVSLIVHDAGIEEPELSNGIDMYPNPTSGIINILSLNEMDKLQNIELWDINGRKLFPKSVIQGPVNQIDLSGYDDGVYFVKVRFVDNVLVRKVVVRH